MCKIVGVLALGVALFRSGRATDPRLASWQAELPKFASSIRRCFDSPA